MDAFASDPRRLGATQQVNCEAGEARRVSCKARSAAAAAGSRRSTHLARRMAMFTAADAVARRQEGHSLEAVDCGLGCSDSAA